MKIAIDASRSTVERMTGTEHYSRQLIHHLILQNETELKVSRSHRDKVKAAMKM